MKIVEYLNDRPDLLSPGISACQGCAAELCLRRVLQVFGENTVVGVPPGCMAGAGVVGWNRLSGMKVPVHIPLLDNTAAFMAGAKANFLRQGRDVNAVAFAGDGASADAGLQCLSAAAERGDNIVYICYDNEGYMNTGFQRSGTTTKGSYTTTTPVGAVKKGKTRHKKNLPLIMAMHRPAYCATISPAYPEDMMRKLEKAATVKNGLVYLHIFSPCPTGWGFPPHLSIEVARLAVQTRFFPLFEAEDGKLVINQLVPNPKPVGDLLGLMHKFAHLQPEDIEDIQQEANDQWAAVSRLAENS